MFFKLVRVLNVTKQIICSLKATFVKFTIIYQEFIFFYTYKKIFEQIFNKPVATLSKQ